MDLRALRAFCEVVRQGGFSQAARAIHATQPTVSKAVRQLEDEIGMPLLDRQRQPPRLTAAGDIVFRRAQAMLAEREDLVAELQELRGLRRGVLRLGLPLLGSSILFAPLFARFRSRYPGIEISLAEHGSRRLEDMVSSGEIELGATLTPVPPAFEYQAVTREPLMALIPPDHCLADAPSLRLAQLRDTPFILFDSGFALNPLLLQACERAGYSPAVAAQRPDRLHRRPGRFGPGRVLPAPPGGRATASVRGAPGPAGRARRHLGNDIDLASRRLPLACRPGLAGPEPRGLCHAAFCCGRCAMCLSERAVVDHAFEALAVLRLQAIWDIEYCWTPRADAAVNA